MGPTGLLAEWVGAALLVRRADSSPWTVAAARALPAEPDRTAVVVDAEAVPAGDWEELADLLASLPRERQSRLRVVLSWAGCAADRAPARILADRLGADVIAPDGHLVLTTAGMLFVARPQGGGGWWRFAPGRPPVPDGMRYPRPGWERHLPARTLRSRTGMVAEPIPAGLWVHQGADEHPFPGRLDDPAFAVPPDPMRIAVVVGGPAAGGVDNGELAEIVGALPPAARDAAVLLPYARLTAAGGEPPAGEPAAVPPVPTAGTAGATPATPARARAAVAPRTPPLVELPPGRSIEGGVAFDPAEQRLEPSLFAPWWSPDAGLFAVFVGYDAESDRFRAGSRSIDALRLAEAVAARPEWDARPVLLVTDALPAGSVVQTVADALHVATVAGRQRHGRWWAALPRRPGTPGAMVRDMGTAYPFRRGDVEALSGPPPKGGRGLVRRRGSLPHEAGDRRGVLLSGPEDPSYATLRARMSAWGRQHRGAGAFGVAVGVNGTEQSAPFRVGGRPATSWDVASTLADAGEPGATAAREIVLLADPPGPMPDRQAQLVANYLRRPVLVVDAPLWTSDVDNSVGRLELRRRPRARVLPTVAFAAGGGWVRVDPVRSGGAGVAVEPPADPAPAGPRFGAPAATQGAADGLRAPILATRGPAFASPDGLVLVEGAVHRHGPGDTAVRATPVNPAGVRFVSLGWRLIRRRATPPAPAAAQPVALASMVAASASAPRPSAPPPPVPRPPVPPPPVPPPPVPAAPVPPPWGEHVAVPSSFRAPRATGPTIPAARPVASRHGILAGHRSTPQERTQFRAVLAGRYDVHARSVTRTLASRPGMRAGGFGDTDGAPVSDLVAVRAYASDDGIEVDRALRSQDPSAALATAGCVASGLRRLPSFRGVVFRGAPPPLALDAYRPGTVLTEPAFLTTTSSDDGRVPADAVFAIWSSTGRRIAGLEVDGGADCIVFAANTAFKVLAEHASGAPGGYVLLRELPDRPEGAQSGGGLDDHDRATVERLRQVMSDRPDGDGGNGGRPLSYRHTFPVGVDDAGQPFGPVGLPARNPRAAGSSAVDDRGPSAQGLAIPHASY